MIFFDSVVIWVDHDQYLSTNRNNTLYDRNVATRSVAGAFPALGQAEMSGLTDAGHGWLGSGHVMWLLNQANKQQNTALCMPSVRPPRDPSPLNTILTRTNTWESSIN